MNNTEGHKCIICGKEINCFSLYCQDPHCQHLYERKLNIIHNSKAYKLYIIDFNLKMEEMYFNGLVEL